jgi:hypothetical protein
MRSRILEILGKGLPFINWCFLIIGLIGAVSTAIGLLSAYNGSLWARITTVLLWLLLAREGYEPLAEEKAERRG